MRTIPTPRRNPAIGAVIAVAAGAAALVPPVAAGAGSGLPGTFTWDASTHTLVYTTTAASDIFSVIETEDGRFAIGFDEAGFDASVLDCGHAEVYAGFVCTPRDGSSIDHLRIRSGAGQDYVSVWTPYHSPVDIRIEGGPDNDGLTAEGGQNPDLGVTADVVLVGGAGDDTLRGGFGDDLLLGGGGTDNLWGNQGKDVLRGGAGNDVLQGDGGQYGGVFADVIDGGRGIDHAGVTVEAVDYFDGTPPYDAARLSLDGLANDGRSGGNEGDNLRNVETIGLGGGGQLIGNNKANYLFGQISERGLSASGLGGGDLIEGSEYNDKLDGGAGPDQIVGHDGNDVIVGGPGRDDIRGDDSFFDSFGNDTIRVVDGEADTVDCGNGNDVVFADPVDAVSDNCEDVRR